MPNCIHKGSCVSEGIAKASETGTQASEAVRQQKLTFTTSASVSVVTKLYTQLYDNPDTDSDQASASNLCHNLLQIGHVVGGPN